MSGVIKDLRQDAAIGYALHAALARGDVSIKLKAGGKWNVSIRGMIGREQLEPGVFRNITGIVGRGKGYNLAQALTDAQMGCGLTAREKGASRG